MTSSTFQSRPPEITESNFILRPPGADGAGEGFRVDWELISATLQGEFPLHLDGLLASVAFRQAAAGNGNAYAARHQLPLEKGVAVSMENTDHEEYVHAASRVMFLDPISTASPLTYTRNTSVPAMARDIAGGVLQTRRAGITLGTGPDKLYLLTITPQFFRRAVAYGVGDIEAVRHALKKVSSLGGERRLGYGAIRSCKVTPDDRARELWRCRALPLSMQEWTSENHFMVQGTVRPDYFAREQREHCYEWDCPVVSTAELSGLTP